MGRRDSNTCVRNKQDMLIDTGGSESKWKLECVSRVSKRTVSARRPKEAWRTCQTLMGYGTSLLYAAPEQQQRLRATMAWW